MPVKMRVCSDPEVICSNCGAKYADTREMYDIMLFGKKYNICYFCNDQVFKKSLRASCLYNSKVKKKDDLERARREDSIKCMRI